MNSGGLDQQSTNATFEGQVCDRCRQRKVKCDGTVPNCSNCAAIGATCEVSTKLLRKTKIRGYAPPSHAGSIERLEKENEQLRTRLQAQIDAHRSLQTQYEGVMNQLSARERPSKRRKINDPSVRSGQSPAASPSNASELSSQQRPMLIIKHMGRMVFDHKSVGRFAGSTTGIHFVASVESLCHQIWPSLGAFPEDCFRLYLAPFSDPEQFQISSKGRKNVQELLQQPVQYYFEQLEDFEDVWAASCPIIPTAKFATDLNEALTNLRKKTIDGKTSAVLQILLLLRLINDHTRENDPHGSMEYVNLIRELQPQVVESATLESLQAMILFSFYLQISGQTSWLIQANGAQVRIAQSLGMHRHARRFKFSESEVELRKRMWWWVYAFDKLTSLVHGLPQLINDFDVDNDIPIDCDINDTSEVISHPLPGERTSVLLFIQYVQFSKLLSAILSQLYTTSQRRGGEEKIAALDRNLRVWHQNYNNAFHLAPFDVDDVDRTVNKVRLQKFDGDESYLLAWLDIMANYALILIHRPALTFESVTQRFHDSLKVCLRSSYTILQLATVSRIHTKAITGVPFGANMVFQCALLHVYGHCNSIHLDTEVGIQGKMVIDKAVRLLNDIHSSSPLLRNDVLAAPLAMLETLSKVCYDNERTEIQPSTQAEGQLWNSTAIVIPHTSIDQTDVGAWNVSALENLNQLDDFYNSWDGMPLFETSML